MKLYENTKAMVCSPDVGIGFFDSIAGVLRGDTLEESMFIIYQDYIIRMLIDLIKGNGSRGIMVIVVGNGHGDTSSNPGRDWLHFT